MLRSVEADVEADVEAEAEADVLARGRPTSSSKLGW